MTFTGLGRSVLACSAREPRDSLPPSSRVGAGVRGELALIPWAAGSRQKPAGLSTYLISGLKCWLPTRSYQSEWSANGRPDHRSSGAWLRQRHGASATSGDEAALVDEATLEATIVGGLRGHSVSEPGVLRQIRYRDRQRSRALFRHDR
jgi:hypothetical protein